jgi:hypothetical protein
VRSEKGLGYMFRVKLLRVRVRVLDKGEGLAASGGRERALRAS